MDGTTEEAPFPDCAEDDLRHGVYRRRARDSVLPLVHDFGRFELLFTDAGCDPQPWDAGPPDAGPLDGGHGDGGDAGVPDGGDGGDAGRPDGGHGDGG